MRREPTEVPIVIGGKEIKSDLIRYQKIVCIVLTSVQNQGGGGSDPKFVITIDTKSSSIDIYLYHYDWCYTCL